MTYAQLLAAIEHAHSIRRTIEAKQRDAAEAYTIFDANTYGRALADERLCNAKAMLDEEIDFSNEWL